MTTHPKQHGGWASQAQRRGEEYRACNTCGARAHPGSFRVVEEEQELNWAALVIGALGALFLFYALFVALLVVVPA